MTERHPADSRDLDVVGGAPTNAPIVRLLDVLMATTARAHEADEGDFDVHPPVTEQGTFDLGYGLRIGRLSLEDAELVINACMQRDHFFFPARQYGQRYAYIYEPTEQEWRANCYGWDPARRVNAALQFWRLVRDNTDSMESAARIFMYQDGERQVVPRHDCELGRAYSLHHGRDWLDAPDAEAPRHLLDCDWRGEEHLPGRVRRAAAHLQTERYVEDRLGEASIALESLINAGKGRVSRQFIDRVHALGTELAVPGVTRSWCLTMYEARSHGLHGADIELFSESGPPRTKAVEYVARLEKVLRRAVRQAVEDSAFCTNVADDAAVMRWYPVPEPAREWRAGARVNRNRIVRQDQEAKSAPRELGVAVQAEGWRPGG